MALSSTLIAAVAAGYMAILFAIAFWGDRRKTPLPPRLGAWVYALSLAVYCSSWTFFGAVGQAADQLWSFLPIYLGPILLLLGAPWVMSKLVAISKQENITSIADFIAARYGKSRPLAIAVALICLIGVLPYIALQLKAIVLGVDLLSGTGRTNPARAQDTALIVSLVLALFTIVFGTRSLDVTEHHRGMVLAVAFESLVKLLAFLAVGVFVCWQLFASPLELFSLSLNSPVLADFWQQSEHWPGLLIQTGVAVTALLCLPRQFHVMVVENTDPKHLKLARWVFPAYLLLAGLFVIPIALAGQVLLPAGISPDSFVISLPLAKGEPALALLAFIGGASAATGMVIVEAVALSTMISNDLLLPAMMRRHSAERPFELFRHWLLSARRISIVVILLLAYVIYRLLGESASLATIGQVAFTAIAQLGPALIGALLWRGANRRGVFAGLAAGGLLWAYLLVLPLLAGGLGWSVRDWPLLHWLGENPWHLPLDPLALGALLSLLGNFALFISVSLLSRSRVAEHWQAGRFISPESTDPQRTRSLLAVTLEDLLQLSARFVGQERAQSSFAQFAAQQGRRLQLSEPANDDWIVHSERLLAGVLGASSARAVVKAAIEGRQMQLDDVVRIADEASQLLEFNRALLQGAIENISQGLSVVDKHFQLVAWNSRYIELFDYPEDLVQLGRPIAEIIAFNAKRGLLGPGDPEQQVAKRLAWMALGTAHKSERVFPNGRVIELIGNPMPGGGFVMSFTDISDFRRSEQALTEAKEGLEKRVAQRTAELSQLNQALGEAKAHAEAANQSKTRFLATVSHDLLQPLNAARLFCASLGHQEALPASTQPLLQHLDGALRSAEELIADLLEISRLEGGRIAANVSDFALDELFSTLSAEFTALAAEQQISLKVRSSRVWVRSDAKLLRRIVQNFLTNAFRYAHGQVLLGVRRQEQSLRIEVWDKGPGIPEEKRQEIFEEFKRLDSHQTRAEKGLGLGLAIADGLCRVLGHELSLRSWPGKGSVFAVSVPLAQAATPSPQLPSAEPAAQGDLSGLCVLCVDNEDSILAGIHSLLSRWGCTVWTARNRLECDHLLSEGVRPQLALLDFHLDAGDTGEALLHWLRAELKEPLAGLLISADARPELANTAKALAVGFMTKPVKPAKLRALLNHFQSTGSIN